MKQNGERRPEDIQADIHRTRSNMDATLSAIESRLTPGQLMDQGIDYLRHSGAKDFFSNLGTQTKNNPMPVALVGIGLAWLMAGGKNPPAASSYDESSGSWSSSLSGAGERISSAKEGAKERLAGAKASLTGTAQSARERLSSTALSARQSYERARGGYDSMMREQPLALGAIGLAIGAVLAAALPRTRKEDELMGGTRDRLAEQAKDAAVKATESVQSAVQQQQSKPQALPRQGVAQPAVPAQSVGSTSIGQPPR